MAPRRTNPNSCKGIENRKLAPKTISKAATRKPKSMKSIFAGKTMSFAGDFEPWTHDQMALWIKIHGGEYVREVTKDTTHLICTIEEYKKKTSQVRKAWELGGHCHIVIKEWLEDCLPSDNSKKRCRAEKGYTINRVLNRVGKSLLAKQKYRESFEANVRASHEMVDNSESYWSIYEKALKGPKSLGLNHIYVDESGFEYKIVCTRINTEGRVKSEKYTIYLFESNAKPHHYMFGAKLSQPGRSPSYNRLQCHPKPFLEAFKDFTSYFYKKTGIEWANRLHGVPQIPDPWKYSVPMLGRPVGIPPPAEKIPEEVTREEENNEDDEDASDDSGVGLIHETDSEVSDPYDSENSPKLPTRGRRSVSIVSIVSSVSVETISSGSGSEVQF